MSKMTRIADGTRGQTHRSAPTIRAVLRGSCKSRTVGVDLCVDPRFGRQNRLLHILSLVLLLLLLFPLPTQAETVAWVGATVHPVSGPVIDNGTLLVEDGKLAAVGADVEIPADARTEDLTGLHVYPAFVHPASVLGLVEVASIQATDDSQESGDLNPQLRTEVAFHADSTLLPVTQSGGILTAHVVPRGGLFAGTSALMRLDGWNWREMTVAAPVGMHLYWPDPADGEPSFRDRRSAEERKADRTRRMDVLDDVLGRARAYDRAWDAYEAGDGPEVPRPDVDPSLDALRPMVNGELPVFVHAGDIRQIDEALEWVESHGLDRVVLVAGADVRLRAERLADAGIPVILNGVLRLPSHDWEPYDAAYGAAAELHEAGVRFALGDGLSTFGAFNARNLPFHAAMAAAFGLPRDEALASVTLRPAEILGVGDRLGSLDAGKDATFLITDGDPLEITTHILRAVSAGREVDLSRDRQKQLYERYRGRPPAETSP